ncbi:MAG: HD-GYP domain-containing protein [Actinomycetota bacterium]|nr:HD-GYP domain-containing protein [Actinomycetota bacterium]
MFRLLPKVLAATALVAFSPLLAVWGLGRLGVVHSPALAAVLGAALSLAAYHLAATVWQRRRDAADVLFGDLMLWGWVRRCVQQRRITDAAALLGAGRGTIGCATSGPGTAGGATAGRDHLMLLSPARRVQMLERLASDLEARDPYTLGHSRRVARFSALIGKRMGVPNAELSRIRTAAAVHDIGKLLTPLDVLHKPGGLTDAEFELIKRHPSDGARMVEILEDGALTEIVLRHHERLDGSGYPGGLQGEEVSRGARIIAVADTFDAITSSRSYRAARPHKQALDILRAEAGTRLDEDAVGAFLSAYLGRRPFGAWVAFTDIAERLLAWLAGDVVGTGSRLAAIAAGTVAVGGGALVLPAPTHHAGRASAPRLTLSRDRVSSTGPVLAGASATRVLHSGAATSASVRRARTGAANRSHFRGSAGKRHGVPRGGRAGVTAPGTTPAGSPTGAPAATSSGAAGPGGSGSANPPSSPTVSLGAGSTAGRTHVGVGVGAAGSGAKSVGASTGQGSGATSVGVKVTGGSGGGSGSAPTVSAGASVGQTSAGVTVTVSPGKGPVGVGVGISIGGLPPIKIP